MYEYGNSFCYCKSKANSISFSNYRNDLQWQQHINNRKWRLYV